MPNLPTTESKDDVYWVVFAYSEWLDGQGLIKSDQSEDADTRSHEELVLEYLRSVSNDSEED